MKKNILYIILALFTFSLTACTGDLDQMPQTESDTDADAVFSTADGYQKALAKIYASYVIAGQEKGGGDGDLSSNNGYDFLRGYFNLQEGATEEMAATWLSGDNMQAITYMSWDDSDPWVEDTYYRAYYTISLCNEFLSHATDEAIAAFPESEQAQLKVYQAEARFLRALSYWHVLDLFGQGPYVDETMELGTFFTPERYSNAQLFAYIKSEIDAITADGNLLANPGYGHASKAAAWTLGARLCLNAEIYGAGNHYSDCLAYCDEVLKAGFSLEPEYAKLFNADNNKRTNEIIFSLIVDATNTVSWGATTYIVCGEVGNSSTQIPADYGVTTGWGMFRVRGELPALFEDGDSRAMFHTDEQTQYFTKSIDDQTQGYFGEKYSNLTDAGEAASNTAAYGASIDFPVFRLADVYLMAAEAILRGGTLSGYDTTTALQLVNDVRARAFGDENHSINAAQLTLQYILDERGRELYWECIRRTDLVRYNQFTTADYIWQYKGGVLDGRAVSSKYNIYPIPAAELSANPNLSNPNY